jgi:hypothetical protein
MAGLTLSTANEALKEDYQPVVRDQINQAIMLLMQVEKNTRDVEGKRAVLSLHVKRSSGIGARQEGGTLPTAGNQTYAEERVPLKYNYGRIQVSGPVIRAMKSDRGSFVRAVQSETQGVTNDLKRDVNRQVWGDASGKIATCGTTTAATTVVLASTTTQAQLRQLEVGQTIDIGTTADVGAVATGRTINSVDFANKTIDISGAAVTTSSSHFIYRAGLVASGSSANGVEMNGIQSIVKASGTLFNIDPSTYPVWKSYVDSAVSNRSVSENLFASVMHNVRINSGEDPNLIVASDGVYRAYANLLTALKRFPNTLDLKGGFKALDMSAGTTGGGTDVGFTWDRDAPGNKAWFLNTAHLTEYVASDWEFMDDDGAVLSRVANIDAYEATLFRDAELATDRRNAHGLCSELTEA